MAKKTGVAAHFYLPSINSSMNINIFSVLWTWCYIWTCWLPTYLELLIFYLHRWTSLGTPHGATGGFGVQCWLTQHLRVICLFLLLMDQFQRHSSSAKSHFRTLNLALAYLQVGFLAFHDLLFGDGVEGLISALLSGAVDGVGVHLVNIWRKVRPRQQSLSLPPVPCDRGVKRQGQLLL